MKRIFLLLPIPLFFTAFFACSQSASTEVAKDPGGKSTMTVGFYNVENLFDTVDDPNTDDEDFTPEGRSHWTEADYQQKLINLAEVISQLGDEDGPELLGLGEVENRKVLEDLVAQDALKKHNYKIVHKDSPDHRGIDVAMLYKKGWFDPQDITMHTVDLNDPEHPDGTTRDIMSVTGELKKGGELTVVLNHWPSRRGGAEQTEFKRAAAAKVAKGIVNDRLSDSKDAKVLLMGDFNDEPTNNSILKVLGGAGSVEDAKSTGLYNPMFELKTSTGLGTYRYKGEFWNMLDQVIMTEGLFGSGNGWRYVEGSAAIYHPPFMCEKEGKYKDAPLKGVLGGHFREIGQSDHFPVYVHLQND